MYYLSKMIYIKLKKGYTMFAIYNKGSVSFRSTADNLYEIKNTQRAQKPSLKPDDDTLFQDYLDKDQKGSSVKQEQLNIYKQMAHMNTSDVVYHIKDIMTQDSINVYIHESVNDAYNKLREYQVSQVPVVSKDEKIMGMINKKLILNLLMEDIDYSSIILKRELNDIYLPEVITTDPISDIRRVAKVMIDFSLDAIPVVNKNDTLMGIVSKTDIIKAVSNIPRFQLWS